MIEINLLATLVAAVAVFVVGFVWYTLFDSQVKELSGGDGATAADADTQPPWKLVVELLRSVIVSAVLGGLAAQGDIDGLGPALLLGLALWVGFPVVLLTGSVIWADVPPKLAALHAGDWLVKLLVIAAIVGAWH